PDDRTWDLLLPPHARAPASHLDTYGGRPIWHVRRLVSRTQIDCEFLASWDVKATGWLSCLAALFLAASALDGDRLTLAGDVKRLVGMWELVSFQSNDEGILREGEHPIGMLFYD